MMGTSGIVGPCILQAAGAGYSFKLLKTDQVAVAFFGDGAANNGAFHEGLNLASIWDLPVLFVCENNQFATEVPFQYAAGNPRVWQPGGMLRHAGVRARRQRCSGASMKSPDEAVRRARSGQGPTLIECRTYRTRAHAEGMGDFTYRTREDVDDMEEALPDRAAQGSPALGRDSRRRDELDTIADEVTQQIAEAEKFAEASPWPDPATAADHIYAAPSSRHRRSRFAVRPIVRPRERVKSRS